MDTPTSGAERVWGEHDEGAAGEAGRAGPMAGFSQERAETLFADLRPAGVEEGVRLFESEDRLAGFWAGPAGGRIGQATESVYGKILALTRRRNRCLARIWNYVPGINAVTAEGLEAYRVFCRARARAFDAGAWLGSLPAASAVGARESALGVVFVATRGRPLMRENPEQVPAYVYPSEYGPRAPSFSRAAQVRADGRRWTFVSGTAAIKGHASVARGDLAGQIDCTLDNLRLVSGVCGLGPDLAEGRAEERHFTVYLRREGDLGAARGRLGAAGIFARGDRVSWLRADICRAELLVEVEATVVD
jgi:hypothetical protein